MVTTVCIGDRPVGPGQPCFIIAEAGVNHNGDTGLAHALVDAAADAGADAVKFQTFDAGRLVSRSAPKAAYQLEHTDHAESQFEMLRRLELPEQAHRELIAHCATTRLMFLSTPFDEASADVLESLGVGAYKIPSGELTNVPFLAHVASKGKPVIVSTGMATLAEVDAAVHTIRKAGNCSLILLHCVSSYPAEPREVNLRAMATMSAAFDVPVGYSDHTLGLDISLAAVALGACVIEKHFTLDRTLPGPDHQASLEPAELKSLVDGVRRVESALGDGTKQPARSELAVRPLSRKSVHWRRALRAGEAAGAADSIALRPGTGFPPSTLASLVGRRLTRAVCAGDVVCEEDFQ